MKYRLSMAARRDLGDIWVYIARDNVRAADRLIDRINRALSLVATQPLMGRNCSTLSAGLRRFPVGEYVIFYRHRSKQRLLEIVRVLRGARDIEEILKEME